MRSLPRTLALHQAKLWMLATVVLAVLTLNLAAAPSIGPRQWEYRTVLFQIQKGESAAAVQRRFDEILNRATITGWEYAGPCAHSAGERFDVDFVVLRRRAGL